MKECQEKQCEIKNEKKVIHKIIKNKKDQEKVEEEREFWRRKGKPKCNEK